MKTDKIKKRKKILIVDDTDIIRVFYSTLLQKHGYDVFSSSRVADGLGLMEEHDFSLIICDIDMPKVNGIEFLQIVKKKFRDIKCALMSSHEFNVNVLNVLGAMDFWLKTSRSDMIVSRVNQLINEERRATLRFSMELPVRVNKNAFAKTVNISSDGLLFKTNQSFEKGDEIEIYLTDGRDSSGINLSGEVVQSKKLTGSETISSMKFFENIGSQLWYYFSYNGMREFKMITSSFKLN